MSYTDREIAEAIQDFIDYQVRQQRRFIRPRISVNIIPPLITNFPSQRRRNFQQFEDVRVVTDNHTLNNLKSKKFDINEKYHHCSICITDFEKNEKITELPCGHLFHPSCIDTWLSSYACKCPVCKTVIGNPTPQI
jgi:hypothetical protein